MAPKMKRPTSSSFDSGTTYQVFLSFRGPDTRLGFADILFHALTDAGIYVFRDNEEIRKGEEIGDEILSAIDQSRVFVPIFSKNYAASRWCLMELAKMFESMEASGGKKKILPIFYDVSVRDVMLKTELYTGALMEQRMKLGKFSEETVGQWEEALRRAGKKSGYELKDQGHGDFVKSFVREVSSMLKVKHTLVTDYLVQRYDQVEALMKLLDIDAPGVHFVGIHGMGGIGKTTLARVVFNKLCDCFDQSCFLADVRESSMQKGIEKSQEQLLESAGLKSGEIRNKYEGIKRILNMPRKRFLLVLDDIDHDEQMRYLAGDASWFGSGSRIIITTRDQGVFRDGIQTLEAEIMNPEEALRLFSKHAFDQDSPPNEYLSLSEEAVASTGRLPLALEVIGSLLGKKRSIDYWVKTIDRLKKVPHKDVQKKLMVSYEALEDEAKQIFLDVACFFIGHDKIYPIYMWEACEFDPEVGLEDLINLSLVKIFVEENFETRGKSEKLWMHDQLRDMGRNIARRNRLWREKEALKVVQLPEGNENIEMLRLISEPQQRYIELKGPLLKLRYVEFMGRGLDVKGHSLPSLTWLSWRHCMDASSVWRFSGDILRYGLFGGIRGPNLCLRNLTVLIVDFSPGYLNEDWGGWRQIGASTKLKVLEISDCICLKQTPDFSDYTSLERLTLRGCPNLIRIHPSIGKLKCLQFLNLFELDHSGSEYFFKHQGAKIYQTMEELPDSIGHLGLLVELHLPISQITQLPDFFEKLKNLRVINISWTRIQKLPTSIGMLKRLEELYAFFCLSLEEIPPTIEWCTCLRVLDLRNSGVRQLPPKLPISLTDLRLR